jgi:hypothetical protein
MNFAGHEQAIGILAEAEKKLEEMGYRAHFTLREHKEENTHTGLKPKSEHYFEMVLSVGNYQE